MRPPLRVCANFHACHMSSRREQVGTFSCASFSFCLLVLSIESAPFYWSNVFNREIWEWRSPSSLSHLPYADVSVASAHMCDFFSPPIPDGDYCFKQFFGSEVLLSCFLSTNTNALPVEIKCQSAGNKYKS